MFGKVSKSKLAGVGIGAGATAIIQSSSATTVMVVGFVNVGIMSLYQATSVIMGANIGTTITAHIASLAFLDFDIVQTATALTVVGIFMEMLCKKDSLKTIGLILAGLGLVFVGLEGMGGSMSIFSEDINVRNLISGVELPVVALLVGIIVTALVQSSSAVTSIIISMVGSNLAFGAEGSSTVLFLILGTNIGTCVTAILSAIGASRNAKRACVIHLMFNTFGSLLFFPLIAIWDAVAAPSGGTFMSMTFGAWFASPAQQIAMFHTFFNVLCTLIFLPFTNVFVKLSGLIIREKKDVQQKTSFMDKRLLKTPSIAIEQLGKERIR
ncbi:MAG: Na/Pi cotransporter family protein, partial [Clostridia bacterium]|nr:Na/Pi cotransporter family protein [Clostridia bacterium]